MKKSLLNVLMAMIALTFLACSDDETEPSIPESSASVAFDGTSYNKAEDDVVTYLEFSFNDVTSYSISANVANGNDTLSLSINIPELVVADYSKSTTDDTEVSISLTTLDNSRFTTAPIFVTSGDPSDYTLSITSVTENTIRGEFTSTLYNDFDEETTEVSGEFTAVNFELLFSGLF